MKRLPFNACDYRCERCHVTAECAVFQKLQERSLLHTMNGSDPDDPAVILEDIRKSFRQTEEMIKEKAREFGIDIDAIAGAASVDEIEEQRASTRKDPLFKRTEEFTRETNRFLRGADPGLSAAEKDSFGDLAWHHTVVSVKLYRALGWRTDNPDVAQDGKNSAAVAVKSLTLCIMAFDDLASRYPDLAEKCRSLSGTGAAIREEIRERFKLGGRQ